MNPPPPPSPPPFPLPDAPSAEERVLTVAAAPPLHSVSLAEWTSSARNHGLSSQVALAGALARRLGALVGRAEARAGDAAPENVLVVATPTEVRDVRFLLEAPGRDARPALQEREACVALGELLLQVFSKSKGASSDSSRDGTQPPPPKRRAGAFAANNMASASREHGDARGLHLLREAGMPPSVVRLVGDLLAAADEPRRSDTALTSLEEAAWELAQMIADPEVFLREPSPAKAAERFQSAEPELFGRDEEVKALMKAMRHVFAFVRTDAKAAASCRDGRFLCEAIFLGGFPGSGKSSLLRRPIDACEREGWFVLRCKFDKQVPSLQVLSKAFDEFFERGASIDAVREVARRVAASVDNEAVLRSVCELVPSLGKLCLGGLIQHERQQDIGTSMDKVGSAKNRLHNMLCVLLEAICSVGIPVLLALDDLQWIADSALEALANFVVAASPSSDASPGRRQGLFFVGAYRSNEVKEGDDLLSSIDFMQEFGRANVEMVSVGDLNKEDIARLVSSKLGLPWRYTRELAAVVRSKTRGNPFFVAQFLRSLVDNKMLRFSATSRRWIFDVDVVDMVTISDGVAELLAASFHRLPPELMKTIKIASCLGYQVNRCTIEALDSDRKVMRFCMLDQMELAVEEGILERAGPVYQFTHDVLRETMYALIPATSQRLLHRTIGKNLMNHAASNSDLHLLAVDQINLFAEDVDSLDSDERSLCASLNAGAAKFVLASSGSSFESARSYLDMGIKLLISSRWDTQYELSLDLYEMSASVGCMQGDTAKMAAALDEIVKHARTFEDTLTASGLLVKLLAAKSEFDQAIGNCLLVLSGLGLEFPKEISLSDVLNELSSMQDTLERITIDDVRALPPLTCSTKIAIMRFSNLACGYSARHSQPLLFPLVACKMVQLTLQHGRCDDSIVGFVAAAYALFTYTENTGLSYQIGTWCETLIDESPNRSEIAARCCHEWWGSIKLLYQPHWLVKPQYNSLYKAAKSVGDVESALIARWCHVASSLCVGQNVPLMAREIAACIQEASAFQQEGVMYLSMPLHSFCVRMMGTTNSDARVKSFDELIDIGQSNGLLLFHCLYWQTNASLFGGEYAKVAELSDQYKDGQRKRILEVMRTFFEGVAFLKLAQQTGDEGFKRKGEEAVKDFHVFASMSKENFENKRLLLQAELFRVNGDNESAKTAYEQSIASANEHKWQSEEALASELYGRFLLEHGLAEKGLERLRRALEKYERWGAATKVNEMRGLLDRVAASSGS